MKRKYHDYRNWEEFHYGMWKKYPADVEALFLARAIEFTSDAELYGQYMMRIVQEWPISCEHNLTNGAMNRQAWVGHAACCLAIVCPEHVTRKAWAYLTQEQQDAANAKAQEAIDYWEARYIHGETEN